MLFDKLLFRDRQAVSQQKILERILVKDVLHAKRIALVLEIEPEIARAKAVKHPAFPVKPPERLSRVGKVLRFEPDKRFNNRKLSKFSELVELLDRLI